MRLIGREIRYSKQTVLLTQIMTYASWNPCYTKNDVQKIIWKNISNARITDMVYLWKYSSLSTELDEI